jgi:hypothetical protein
MEDQSRSRELFATPPPREVALAWGELYSRAIDRLTSSLDDLVQQHGTFHNDYVPAFFDEDDMKQQIQGIQRIFKDLGKTLFKLQHLRSQYNSLISGVISLSATSDILGALLTTSATTGRETDECSAELQRRAIRLYLEVDYLGESPSPQATGPTKGLLTIDF